MGMRKRPTPPDTSRLDLERLKEMKTEELAAERWKAETGGTVINGIQIATDDRSQAKITGAALQATIDPGYICQWKTDTGFIDLNAQLIMAIATAVRQFVQSCFDREAVLNALVTKAATAEEVMAIAWTMNLTEVK